jgi:hypothetical protein
MIFQNENFVYFVPPMLSVSSLINHLTTSGEHHELRSSLLCNFSTPVTSLFSYLNILITMFSNTQSMSSLRERHHHVTNRQNYNSFIHSFIYCNLYIIRGDTKTKYSEQ